MLSQALATLVGAMATAVLMAASYYWGPRQREGRQRVRDEDEAREDDAARDEEERG